jgi:hypothetical protein
MATVLSPCAISDTRIPFQTAWPRRVTISSLRKFVELAGDFSWVASLDCFLERHVPHPNVAYERLHSWNTDSFSIFQDQEKRGRDHKAL